MDRMYSVLTVKAVEDDKRIITGTATTPVVDRVGDIIEPLGVKFTNPLPLLHQHDSDRPVGTVKFDKPTKDGITFEARLPKIEEPGPLKDRVDMAWGEIKAGLVRAVSIGFRAIEYAFLEGGGIHFLNTEVLELSLVSVPANSDAKISLIKSIDAPLLAASGKEPQAGDRPSRPGVTGKSHKPVNLRPKEAKTMKTLAEQIAALEAKRAAHTARMEEIQSAASEAGRTKEASEKEEFDTLADEVDTIDGELKDLRRMEATKAKSAAPVINIDKAEDGAAARAGVIQVTQPKLPPGIAFARLAKCVALGKISGRDPATIAKGLYGDESPVTVLLTKAAVPAGNTSDTTWAGNLVGDETSMFADFVEFLRPMTILGKFGTNGVPSLRRVPFRVPLIGQTTGGAGYWVGEGAAKPLTKFDFSRTTLQPLKVANIAVCTMEVLRDSSPSAEAIVRDQLAAALRERLDIDFIDPSKTAVAGVSPASITNAATPIGATGTGTADDVRADIRALFGAFIAANNAPTSGVWIMPATTALALSLMQNPLGQAEFPGINMNGGSLFGLPVIVSEYVPTVSAGANVILVNAQDIYLADEGGINVDMSREASLEMDTAPSHTSTSPSESTLVSLWQTNSVGFLAERTINWAARRSEAVQVLENVNWGTA